jgi:hypothetical protein
VKDHLPGETSGRQTPEGVPSSPTSHPGIGTAPSASMTSTSGVPMIPTKQLVLSTLMGTALGTSAIFAQSPTTGSEKKIDPSEYVKISEFQALSKQMENLQKDIKDLQTFRKDLEDAVLGDRDGAAGKNPGLLAKIAELEATIKKLNGDLTAMDTKLKEATSKSVAGYTPNNTTPPLKITETSTVRIVNEYPVEVSMIINRKAYRVAPNESRSVAVEAGSYTYELLSAGSAPTTSTIKDGETVTLRVR